MQNQLFSRLGPDFPWTDRIHCFDSVDSTNLLAKRMAAQGAPHGTVLLATHQTAGRGRLGRSFHSPAHQGIYLSILLRPQCAPQELMHLTCAAAVAMCDAVEHAAGFRPGIKWTNDLVWKQRKLGGILTELGWTGDGKLDYAIVGIGINRSQQPGDFPDELRDMATSLSMICDCEISAASLAREMIHALFKMDAGLLLEKSEILARYKEDCITLGKDICILTPEQTCYGKALDIDEAGGLTVEFPDGHSETIAAGEVSVRGMYGYI